MARTILLVEDDPEAAALLERILAARGARVWRAETAGDALALLREALRQEALPDLIILDLMLPDMDGLVLCAELKGIADVPTIICSATSRQGDGTLGLKLGADDFIAKPFDVDDLEARVEAVLRRASWRRPAEAPSAPPPESLRIGELVIDRARPRVTLGTEPIPLTPTEYRLLAALAGRPGHVLTRDELAQRVWGYQDASSSRTIDVHIQRLRTKLASGRLPAPSIVGIRGQGYMLVSDTPAPALT